VNRCGLASNPGATIDSSAHSSIRLFSIGVPVTASLNGTGSFFAHPYALALWFFTNCASSRTSPDHDTASYSS